MDCPRDNKLEFCCHAPLSRQMPGTFDDIVEELATCIKESPLPVKELTLKKYRLFGEKTDKDGHFWPACATFILHAEWAGPGDESISQSGINEISDVIWRIWDKHMKNPERINNATLVM